MSNYKLYHEYVPVEGASLFTAILLPSAEGKFPTVILRSPYLGTNIPSVDYFMERHFKECEKFLENGYAVVFQHCRGRGLSKGQFTPFIHEHDDGHALYAWIREQSFYNGELFLYGGSYLAIVHLCCSPYPDDIKGALLTVAETERYNFFYRNGFFKKELGGDWYVGRHKVEKHYTKGSFETLPLSSFSQVVFGHPIPHLDEIFRSPRPEDPYWQTWAGGADMRGALTNAKFPILLMTGFYDVFTGGTFKMWQELSPETKKNSVFLVSPYDHGDGYDKVNSLGFPNGRRKEGFGEDFKFRWLSHVREGAPAPFENGKVTYYNLFENCWRTDDFDEPDETLTLTLGEGAVNYTYNPYDPPVFKGGLSTNFGGGAPFQDPPNSRHDIISLYTEPFDEDISVKGKMRAKLRVSSDCEDTCFFVRISITKEQGDFPLRDDIHSLVFDLGDYTPGEAVDLDFTFDEHAFVIKKGERLRIDLASADAAHYVRHTNQKGLYSEQATAKVAHNTVYLAESTLTLPFYKI